MEKKRKKKDIMNMCLYFVFGCLFYDKIEKNKEEFNILI